MKTYSHVAHLNPFRYRGYMYDEETGFYYLRSRYYDPSVGRFLNADELVSTGQGFDGLNMFAYCGNNPVIRADSSGNLWGIVVGLAVVIGAAFSLTGCGNSNSKADRDAQIDKEIQSKKEKKYNSMDDAAIAAGEYLMNKTKNSNREYGTAIYKYNDDPNSYYTSGEYRGYSTNVTIYDFYVPNNAEVVAVIHTHTIDDEKPHFSSEDIEHHYYSGGIEQYLIVVPSKTLYKMLYDSYGMLTDKIETEIWDYD